jgi:hypothetical protein
VPFEIADAAGSRAFDPQDLASIGDALTILHRDAVSLTVHASGRLEAAFANGSVLAVDKHERYESWEARGEGELSDISMLCAPHEGPPWERQRVPTATPL